MKSFIHHCSNDFDFDFWALARARLVKHMETIIVSSYFISRTPWWCPGVLDMKKLESHWSIGTQRFVPCFEILISCYASFQLPDIKKESKMSRLQKIRIKKTTTKNKKAGKQKDTTQRTTKSYVGYPSEWQGWRGKWNYSKCFRRPASAFWFSNLISNNIYPYIFLYFQIYIYISLKLYFLKKKSCYRNTLCHFWNVLIITKAGSFKVII